MRAATEKPFATTLLFAICCTVPYLSESMVRFRLVRAEAMRAAFVDPFRGKPRSPVFLVDRPLPAPTLAIIPKKEAAAERLPPPLPAKRSGSPENWPLEPDSAKAVMESPEALASFFSALSFTKAGQRFLDPNGITRILHIGDSPLAGDLISGQARFRLQRALGFAGPGWHLPARPWEWYMHEGVTLKASGWKIRSPLLTPGAHGRYGLAGISFSGGTSATYTTISTGRKGPGNTFSRLEIHYESRANGGSFLVGVDRDNPVEVSTKAESTTTSVYSLKLSEAPHEVTVRVKGNGEVTLYGLAMENNQPGVVYDSLGANGASIHFLTLINSENWIESLRLRRPNLVILGFGTNESGYGYLPLAQYENDYKRVIQTIRAALPNVAILIMAPMDRATRNDRGELATMPAIPRLVEAQRRVALANRCAFFNTYQAMGGNGTMARWYQGTPRLVSGDYTHPSRTGADRIAEMLVNVLLAGLNPSSP